MTAHMCREFNPACYRCDLNLDEIPPPHTCNTDLFDRIACPEPCGTMHTLCSVCDETSEPCPL